MAGLLACERQALSLADLEAFDPRPARRGEEARFCCPLPACAGKPRDRAHQSLCVNLATGAWVCHRCQASGKLRERWEQRTGSAWRRVAARRAFSLEPEPPPGQAASAPQLPAMLARCRPLGGTPGERYLAGRGIPASVAAAADARYTADWFGRPAVVFPLRDESGQIVAATGRYVDGEDARLGKTRACGDRKLGVFATPGAWESEPLVIVEAPVDALSLHAAGVPAIALGTTRAPHWLPRRTAFRRVVVGLDCDAAGEEGAASLAEELRSFGATVERWRPDVVDAAKGWNDALRCDAAALQRALAALRGEAPPSVVSLPSLSLASLVDPRPDLASDSALWQRLLAAAFASDGERRDG